MVGRDRSKCLVKLPRHLRLALGKPGAALPAESIGLGPVPAPGDATDPVGLGGIVRLAVGLEKLVEPRVWFPDGRIHDVHGYFVWVRPSSRPQQYAPTSRSAISWSRPTVEPKG